MLADPEETGILADKEVTGILADSEVKGLEIAPRMTGMLADLEAINWRRPWRQPGC